MFQKKSLALILIFLAAIIVWYSPVVFKGYPVYKVSPNVLLGYNMARTGSYSLENKLNVLVASNLAGENASSYGNRLTSLIYAKIFSRFGRLEINSLILISIFFHALALVIFAGMILRLFDLKTSLVFSLVYIFLPFQWILPYSLGIYEFALFFLALFFLFYFFRKNYLLIPAGAFLAAACLAREALLAIVPFLFLYLWLVKKRKQLIYLFVPFALIFAFFWLPTFSRSMYFDLVSFKGTAENEMADFSSYGHIFPDPYTYHFEKEKYLEELEEKIQSEGLINRVYTQKQMANLGLEGVGLKDRLLVSPVLLARHLARFASLEEMGGPLILLLMILGAFVLRKRDKEVFQIGVYWIVFSLLLFSGVLLVSRSHLMDFGWVIALLAAFGLLSLTEIIESHFSIKFILPVLLLFSLYHLLLVNHVVLGDIYKEGNLLMETYAQRMDVDGVTAFGLGSEGMNNLHYLTDKSLVIFQPETVKKLLETNQLKLVFEQFGVKHILGYSDELSAQIPVDNIASASLKPTAPEVSKNKSWLMNLVR